MLVSSAVVVFGGLPGTLCYVEMQPCSLDLLTCACTIITVQNFESKMGEWESKIGSLMEHKRKAKWADKKANFVKAYSVSG